MVSKLELCNLQQVQRGPLNLQVPLLIKLLLSSASSPLRKNTFTPSVFKGYFKIRNNSKQLVAYKVLAKIKGNLDVRLPDGFIEEDETVTLTISSKLVLNDKRKANKQLPIIILATTCEVIDQSIPIDLQLFWNKILHDGSSAFVEVFGINCLRFYNSDGTRLIAQSYVEHVKQTHTGHDIRSSLTCDNNNNYLNDDGCSLESQAQSSSSSSSCYHQYDFEEDGQSEASGDYSSTSIKVRGIDNRGKRFRPIAKMRKLPKRLVNTHKTLVNARTYLLFFMLVIFLKFVHTYLQQCEVNIVATTRKN